ncbi:MAG: hypothetical protein Q9165_008403 [Trypethelium subeluteriae]
MSSDPLTIQTSTAPPPPPSSNPDGQPQTPTADQPTSRPSSPIRPPISPITPRATFAELARYTANRSRASAPPPPAPPPPPSFSHPAAFSSTTTTTSSSAPPLAPPSSRHPPPPPATSFIPQPPPVPFDAEDDNVDALAVKAAISILQVQRERSRQDVRTWEVLRKEAGRDPVGFWEALREGRLRRGRPGGDAGFLGPTLAGMEGDGDGGDGGGEGEEDEEDEDEDEGTDVDKMREGGDEVAEGREGGGRKGDGDGRFPKLPEMQNIFRCPPVNWAKYHVVGESLDKLHEEQMKRPSEGEPTFDPGAGQGSGGIVRGQVDHLGRAPESVVAKPYSMFDDGNLKGSGKGG